MDLKFGRTSALRAARDAANVSDREDCCGAVPRSSQNSKQIVWRDCDAFCFGLGPVDDL
jgi:hypothetical protein